MRSKAFPVVVVVEAIRAERTAIRLSPWCSYNGDLNLLTIGAQTDCTLAIFDMCKEDPTAQFSYFVSQLKARQPRLAFIHLIEPENSGNTDRDFCPHESCDFVRAIWSPAPVISAG
ncbi:hypothetical protein J132_09992 [Termitomyces sp. J132]|nr:hypothetical protein J132_09992 [Termitomyces sp. J132]